MMKQTRHQKILEIISKYEISTQDGLIDKLAEEGFLVTQATISRDIKRLNLTKRLSSGGKYIYSVTNHMPQNSRSQQLLADAVIKTDYAQNVAVIKCRSGMGSAVGAIIDQMEWDSMVGTIAGDDTIFVLMRSEDKAKKFQETLDHMLSNSSF